MFIDFDHQRRFIEWQRLLPNRYASNRAHLSLLLLMSGNEELERKMSSYYDPETGRLAVDDMIAKEDFSSGLGVLARLAVVVFNQQLELNIHELSRLDQTNSELAIHVLRFRYQNANLSQRLQHYLNISQVKGR